MKKKILSFFALSILLIVFTGCFTVNAAQKSIVKLKVDRTYTQYDITNDGKKDKVRIKKIGGENYWGKVSYALYINNKKLYTWKSKSYQNFSATLIRVSSKKQFIDIKLIGDSDHVSYNKVFYCKSSKMICVKNIMSAIRGNFNIRFDSQVKAATSKYIKYNLVAEPGGIGLINCTAIYNISGRKLSLKSYKMPLTYNDPRYHYRPGTSWTANRRFPVYTSTTSGKKIFTIDYFERCKIGDVFFSKNGVWIKVYNRSGKSGWAKCPNSLNDFLFEESIFL